MKKPLGDAAPIYSWVDLSTSQEGDETLYHLGFAEHHIGNPAIRALHGGAIATFLECAAQEALRPILPEGTAIETVNIDIDYMTSSKPEDMTASVKINRKGRRIAFVEATGWQTDRERPVAKARVRIRITTAK